MFKCNQCSKAYNHESTLYRHKRIHAYKSFKNIQTYDPIKRAADSASKIYDDDNVVDLNRYEVADDDQSEPAETYEDNNMNHASLYDARKAVCKKVLALNRQRAAENEMQIAESIHESGIMDDSVENDAGEQNVLPTYVYHDEINAVIKDAIKPLQECLTNLVKNDEIMMESLSAILKEVQTGDENVRDAIKPLQGYEKPDEGQLVVEEGSIKYVYWHDINTLIDRLCVLHTRKQNGNNEHSNEIVSIERILREQKIIL